MIITPLRYLSVENPAPRRKMVTVDPNEEIPGWPILYSAANIPTGMQALRDLDITISWEVSNDEGSKTQGTRSQVYLAGIDELNNLLRRKVEILLQENHAQCAHIKHEKVVHSVNYMHDSSVIQGTYYLTVYG